MPTIHTIVQREAVKTNAFRILDILDNIFLLNTADHVVCDTVDIRSVNTTDETWKILTWAFQQICVAPLCTVQR